MPLTNRERATGLRAEAGRLEGVVSALYRSADELDPAADVPPADVPLVAVKLITNQGALSATDYTYTYHRPLSVGAVVTLPVNYIWQGDTVYGVVQGTRYGQNRGYGEILKVK